MNPPLQEIHTWRASGRNALIALTYNRYGKKLYAYSITRWNVTEDVAWELIYKTIYRVADTHANYGFETEEKFASFVFKIFINYLKNHYRDTKKEQERAFTAMEDVDTSGMAAETSDAPPVNKKLSALNEVLETMQEWERTLLLMRSEGRAYAEIATYINKPEEQLKVYYQRLKDKVSKKLNEGRNEHQ